MSYGDGRSEPLPLPTGGWILTRAALWFADLAIVLPLVLPLMAPTHFGPMWDPQSNFFGMPAGTVTYIVGIGLAITGRLWMERILRADNEPEANDRFWWSRA